ncbi:MAG: hypothetical protein ABI656_12675, partial [bacterium]
SKQLVRRITSLEDRRNTIVQLTVAGERTFEHVFDPHVQYCKQPFSCYSEADFIALEETLGMLKSRLDTLSALQTIKKRNKSNF